MRRPVLYCFLLVLGVFFDLIPDIVNKRGGFFKTLLKESLKFVPCEGSYPVSLNLSLVLLLAEVDYISKEQDCKRDAYMAYSTGRIEIILALLIEIVAFHEQAPII